MKKAKMSRIIYSSYSLKRWHNVSEFCNGKRHPKWVVISYRRYRRGKNRCLKCGCKLGKIKCTRKSEIEFLIENVTLKEVPFISAFMNKKIDN